MTDQPLKEARAQLAELIEAARVGRIIPVRLPGQLEAIEQLLAQAEAAAQEAVSAAPAPSGEAESVVLENAEFMKTAVHELRTPMTSIRGYSDMLANTGMAGPLSEMQAQLLQVIRTNSRRMESLLSDMSYVNKLRAGILRANSKMDMYKNIAMAVEKQTRPLADELNRQLEFNVPQGLPILNVDGELLTHALVKLVENALRYSPEEQGKVIISGQGADSALVITVEDNGIGMTPDEIAQLGTLFFRSEHDSVRAYKGSGLGIPIAFGIIKLLGGTVEVESQLDQGTRFIITLPGLS